jgi:lipoprotein-anchoring transpeptidase ErfK/SrfK
VKSRFVRIGSATAVLVCIALVVIGWSLAGKSADTAPAAAGTTTSPPPSSSAPPASTPPPAPAAWKLPPGHLPGAFLIGRVRSPLHTPAGRVHTDTPFGSDTWLLILQHRGHEGVALVPTAGKPKQADVDLRKLQLRWTRVRIDVDLSKLQLAVMRGHHRLGEFPIAAGMPATPTPKGRFSVTDRVLFNPPGTYGDFALGLSAHQSHLLAGWHGGNQIAIHGTPHLSTIGSYASLGCIRVTEQALRLLRHVVPLGAPVSIHA